MNRSTDPSRRADLRNEHGVAHIVAGAAHLHTVHDDADHQSLCSTGRSAC